MNSKTSIIILTFFAAFLTVVAYKLNQLYQGLVYSHVIFFIIYYYFISIVSTTFVNFAIAKNKDNFILSYLGSMTARFLLSIVVAFIFMILDKPNVMVIGINFVVLHLLFLGLDLFFIIIKINRLSRKDRDVNVG